MRISAEFRMVDNRMNERDTQKRKHEINACIMCIYIIDIYIFVYTLIRTHITS